MMFSKIAISMKTLSITVKRVSLCKVNFYAECQNFKIMLSVNMLNDVVTLTILSIMSLRTTQ